ncbi:MAG: EAL domain-containing protein, partial [Alphaproteobacteria bacterium]|nr:EAL domain-containing protein [Alphaproteobacteria bacterium]
YQKQIEAALGRAVGILTSCVRDYDTLARMGDSVFAIAMSNLEGPNSASIVARRIVQKFSQPSDGLRLTPAIGITVYPIDGPDTDSLLRDAETAMLKAKTFSAPNFRFFDQELNRDAQDRLSLWRELARAQERKEFHIHYQPRIELKNERATGMEALLRWRNPRLGDVEPLRFIPALEEIGGMEPLGAWMLEEVCRQQVEWTKAGHRSLRLSINLSERQLRQRGFLALVRDTVRRTGADPTRIEVEIVEEMLVRDAESCVATLWGLREIGVGVVLDNFGSGDGSVNHLRRFPISVVKVDPQFTGGFSGGRAPAVSAIAGMAHGFEQTVVAEAVETEEQLNVMRASGCDEAQGLLFCPPLPAVEMTARLGLGRWRTRARP